MQRFFVLNENTVCATEGKPAFTFCSQTPLTGCTMVVLAVVDGAELVVGQETNLLPEWTYRLATSQDVPVFDVPECHHAAIRQQEKEAAMGEAEIRAFLMKICQQYAQHSESYLAIRGEVESLIERGEASIELFGRTYGPLITGGFLAEGDGFPLSESNPLVTMEIERIRALIADATQDHGEDVGVYGINPLATMETEQIRALIADVTQGQGKDAGAYLAEHAEANQDDASDNWVPAFIASGFLTSNDPRLAGVIRGIRELLTISMDKEMPALIAEVEALRVAHSDKLIKQALMAYDGIRQTHQLALDIQCYRADAMRRQVAMITMLNEGHRLSYDINHLVVRLKAIDPSFSDCSNGFGVWATTGVVETIDLMLELLEQVLRFHNLQRGALLAGKYPVA